MDNLVFKLLILDVDGVLTDGTKVYDASGKAVAKSFNDKDFTAIKRFKAAGISVCFLSGDANINMKIAFNRNIDFYSGRNEETGVISKVGFLPMFSKKYNVEPSEMAYVGDDFFDLDIMEKVGYRYCPLDSPNCVCEISEVLHVESGDGVVAALYDHMGEDIKHATREEVDGLDKDEKF